MYLQTSLIYMSQFQSFIFVSKIKSKFAKIEQELINIFRTRNLNMSRIPKRSENNAMQLWYFISYAWIFNHLIYNIILILNSFICYKWIWNLKFQINLKICCIWKIDDCKLSPFWSLKKWLSSKQRLNKTYSSI